MKFLLHILQNLCLYIKKIDDFSPGFNFTIYQAKSYGHFDNQTRTWKGMIGELVSGVSSETFLPGILSSDH